MDRISRRNFMFLSSGAVVGNMLVGGSAEADEGDCTRRTRLDHSRSGLVTGKPKPLRHQSIPGFLTAQQIAPHHAAHYGGALSGYKAADRRIEESIQSGRPIEPAAYGSLKRNIAKKGNSVVLHELYFDGLAPSPPDPTKEVRAMIENRFGSLDRWADDFIVSAKGAAGWAVLARHPVNGKLYNVVSDEHAVGVVWMATPLVVLDTYEHAFYIDYQNRKADYVERFIDHIDWKEVGMRDAAT